MGRMVALVMACRINSAWLMSQFFSRSVKSAYSSSVMRVLTTRLRWGVLYRFPMGINSFHLPPFCGRFFKYFWWDFQAAQAAQQGLGKALPNKIYQRGKTADMRILAPWQNLALRNCRFPLRLTLRQSTRGGLACFRQYSDCGGVSYPLLLPSTDGNGKCQTLLWIFSLLLRQASAVLLNPAKLFKANFPGHSLLQANGAVCQKWTQKKQQIFSDLLLVCPL